MNNMKVFRYSRLICFLIGSVLLFIFREFFVEHLRFFIGGLMIVYGMLGITEMILEKVKPIYIEHEFLFNLLEILIGLVVLIFLNDYHTICVVWAMWSILRESLEIRVILVGKLHSAFAIVNGIESLAVIVLSILLMMEPGEHHALIHSYLLCVELVLTGLVPIINEFMLKNNNESTSRE